MSAIPLEMRPIFESAFASFHNWAEGYLKAPATCEGAPSDIQDIFRLARQYTDEVNDEVFCAVVDWAQKFQRGAGRGLPCDGPKERTYRATAECLLQLCHAKSTLYEPDFRTAPKDRPLASDLPGSTIGSMRGRARSASAAILR